MSVEQVNRPSIEVHIPEIDLIESTMRQLLEELKPNLLQDTYGLIVGDDTSGTIPALITAIVANKLNHDLEREATPFIFLKGSKQANDIPKITEQLRGNESLLQRFERDKKVLIVTEHMGEGRAATHLQQALLQENIESDIAALTAERRREYYRLDGSVFIGEEGSELGYILMDRTDLTGKLDTTFDKLNNSRFLGVRDGVMVDKAVRIAPLKALRASRQLAERIYENIFRPDVQEMTET